MQKGMTLSDLARTIEAQSHNKRDMICDTGSLNMGIDHDDNAVLQIPDQGAFPIQPLAHDQIGARLGIPSKYYDRMLNDAPDLLAANVNTWFRQNPERRMVRTLGGHTRAFLSSRYLRTENEEIAKVALPILHDLPGVEIPSCCVTDKRLYIHFTVPTIRGEVKTGDIVQAGGIIQNSEVGCGAVSVQALLWRLVCLNGAKVNEGYRRAHIGREVEENGEIEWSDETRKSDDATVLLKVRDMVRAVVDETRFKANLAKLQDLSQVKVEKSPEKAVEVLAAKIGATDTERGTLWTNLINGGDLSAWGLVNAVTSLAHTATTYDRAVELEAAGGALIDLPASDWKRVLQAA
jgi:hypothetical protein